ncbi:tyrosine-type recombinase/integrase [Streptomyces sp. NPDC005279]|uniref:tyrosine-type recombinase/integrase n=1 Tax=Streptomyces sp. NPDC005279 TaxID=3364712 RepID=UPI0036C42DE4
MTNPAELAPEPVAPIVPLDTTAWTRWLQEQVNPLWRPGEWSQAGWFFNGDALNSRTATDKCMTPSCWTLLASHKGFCRQCRKVYQDSGLSPEEFAATYQRPRPIRLQLGAKRGLCTLERSSRRCERQSYCRGLCRTHYMRWRSRPEKAISLGEWLTASDAQPMEALPPCVVGGCRNQRVITSLCHSHYQAWERDHHQGMTTRDTEAWAQKAAPNLRSNQFCLRPLEETVRWEVLYGLQRRDARGGTIEPTVTRHLVQRLTGFPSLLTIEPEAFTKTLTNNNRVAQFREIARFLRLATLSFRGLSPTDADIWDLPSLGLKSPGRGGRRQRHGHVDATAIRQPWLREIVKTWASTVSMHNEKFKRTFNACVIASDALHAQPGGGQDFTQLRFANIQAVFTAMSRIRRMDNDELTTRKWRMDTFSAFLEMIDFGRKTDLLDGMPGSFNRDKTLVLPHEETIEDTAGKAVPEPVIAQLDSQLHLMGAEFPYGDMERADIKLMMQTAYQVLRDTGRRPIEIASLRLKCLVTCEGESTLIWDNHKKRRYGRELPVTAETAEVIKTWQSRRRQLNSPSQSASYLFPAITDLSGYAHLNAGNLANAMREWIASVPMLLSDELDERGNRLPFDRSLIFPYAFRHSFAQRHADAGVPVDVLKELMDHRMISTTMSYYQVSLKRKREAITAMRRHAVDRSGRPAPFTSTADYEAQSVAVPFGNCREPSNVKAGGKACPIRFQCAGCGFYRPDPSYLPAIEEHVNSLRADRETAQAMEADDFVVRNLSDQVTAFTKVADRMRDRLKNLPEDEREEIEEASMILRKVRATRDHKLLPLAVVRKESPDAS